MRKLINICLLGYCLLCLCSCSKDCTTEPDYCLIDPAGCDPIVSGTMKVLWSVPITPTFYPSKRVELLLVPGSLLAGNIPGANMGLLDTGDGERIWNWTGFFSTRSFVGISQDHSIALYKDHRDRATVRVSDGQTILHTRSEHRSAFGGAVIGDRFFFEESDDADREAWLLVAPLSDIGAVDTIYRLRDEEFAGANKGIEGINAWIDPRSGDSILIFHHAMYHPEEKRNRGDVVAYNITKGVTAWRQDDVYPGEGIGDRQILIHDNKAYCQSTSAILCFDLPTGALLWRTPRGVYYRSNTVYAFREGLILYMSDGGDLVAVNPVTGSVAWRNRVPESAYSDMIYHGGKAYCISGAGLCCVDITTGRIRWIAKSPNSARDRFNGKMALDRERNILYVADSYYIMALRLPE